jgi:uncharacterized RDD family membrane protein YckC
MSQTPSTSPSPVLEPKPGVAYYLTRIGAQLIDLLICGEFFYLLGMAVALKFGGTVTGGGFQLNGGTALLAFGLVGITCFLYFWLLEGLFGRTLGKMIANLKVVRDTDKRCDLTASAIRNLLRFVDLFFFGGVGLVSILITKRQQRIGDLVAKTFVVKTTSRFLQVLGLLLFLLTVGATIWMGLEMRTLARSAATSRTMAIQNLRFTEGEKGPITNKSYGPGEDVFLNFDLSGVRLDNQGNADTLITFEAIDTQGRLMLEPVPVEVKGKTAGSEGGPIPVYFHLTLPVYASSGDFFIQIRVLNNVSKKELQQRVSYIVKGPQIAPNPAFGIQDYVFLSEQGNAVVGDAVFPRGAVVKSKFLTMGFKLGEQNKVKLRLDLSVTSSSGEKLLDKQNLFQLDRNFFYPPSYLPITTTVTTPSSIAPGAYTLHNVVHDDVAGTDYSFNKTFWVK